MSERSNLIKIPLSDLEGLVNIITGEMKEVSIHTTMNMHSGELDAISSVTSTVNRAKKQTLSYLSVATNIDNTGLLMAEGINKVSLVIHRAFLLATRVSQLYDEASNRDILSQDMGASSERTAESEDKLLTSSAVLAYTAASYVVHELINYRESELESIQIEPMELPAFLGRPSATRRALMFYYIANLEKSGKVKNENDFIKMTIVFFQSVMDAIEQRIDAFNHTEIFTNVSYQLEGSKFATSGFEANVPGHIVHTEVNEVRWDQVVGNEGSKHACLKSIFGLMCYDPVTKSNPMKDLGGFARFEMKYGDPGTGKSMEIAAMATDLGERCGELGLKFLYHPFPQDIIDTFQGGSGQRAKAWFKPILHLHDHLIFASIDDAESNFQNRSDQGVSSGVKEVISVALTSIEGATAIDKGNNLIYMYTNLPGIIDPAVKSRVQKSTHMAGAVTMNDYMDLDYICLIKPFEELMPGFIDITPPKNYKYMSDQNLAEGIKAEYASRQKSDVEFISQMIDDAKKLYHPKSADFFGYMDEVMSKKFIYRARGKRNIQSAVKTRLFDFETPDTWMSDADVFFKQDYDTKKGMIIEKMREFLGGKSFADIYQEETIFYYSNLARIADEEFERRVEAGVEQRRLAEAVEKRLRA